MRKVKLVRITTVPISLKLLLKGQLRFMNENGFEVIGVSSSGKELDEVSKNEGVKTLAIEMSRKISLSKDLKALWKFYWFCKEEKPEIIHSHTPKAGLICMLGAKLAGAPIRIHTVAGLPLMEASGIKRKILIVIEKFVYACSTKIYPNSEGLYDFILKHKFTRSSKLKILAQGSSNGIDTSYFSPDSITANTTQELRKELSISVNDFVFIYVGRIVGDKGINELVLAFKMLQSNYSNLKLLLVGQVEAEFDPLKPETLTEIENNPNILSVGFQKDIRPYFSVSNGLVFPSYREGFPNAVLQAGAMGLPAIVTDINGCNEIIKEKINGLIISPKNSTDLFEAMNKLFKDKDLYQKLKSNARKLIVERFEQKEVWNELLNEYQMAIERSTFKNKIPKA